MVNLELITVVAYSNSDGDDVIPCTDCADRNVTAQAGEAAVLPCTCPPDQPPYLVWQKDVGNQTLVVSAHRDNTEDKPAEEYRNRAELKLTGSCSLTLLSVTPSDQGLYTCYYRTGPITHELIYLEVTGQCAFGYEEQSRLLLLTNTKIA